MKADFNHDVTDIELMSDARGAVFVIRSQVIDQLPSGPRRSGKYIHLTMTARQAMRLLALLHGAQTKLNLPIPADVRLTTVPPAKDRH
jgi:hypothetical protein